MGKSTISTAMASIAFCMFTRPGIHHVGEPTIANQELDMDIWQDCLIYSPFGKTRLVDLVVLCVPGIVRLRLPHMYNYNYNYNIWSFNIAMEITIFNR